MAAAAETRLFFVGRLARRCERKPAQLTMTQPGMREKLRQWPRFFTVSE
jgi:hypothetical protein